MTMDTNLLITLITFIVCYFITLAVVAHLVSRALDIKYQTNKIESDKLIKDTVIDNTAVDALDALIKEVLDEYILLNVKPKDIDYINSKLESEIRTYVVTEITDRISVLLLKKLEYICNADYVGELIGRRVYFHVMEYALEYNTSNTPIVGSN